MATDADPNEGGPGWRDKIDRLNTWRGDLTEEAMLLPKTLSDLRQTIADLRQVSARLEGVTEGIEILLRGAESSGIAPLARQLDAAATEMGSQIRDIQSQLPGGAVVNQAVDELQKAFDSFSGLIPKPKPRQK